MEKSFFLPQFWIQHLDRLWLVLDLIKALKENDFNLYKKTLKSMIPVFFIMNHQNYARYLTAYVASLDHIDNSHPEASRHRKNCALSVTRSLYAASGTAVDQTIEQTINKHAKSEGGVIGFSRNLQAYDRWVLTRHERTLYAAAAFGVAGMSDDGYDRRKDLRKNDIHKGLMQVEKTIETICNFTNPFEFGENNSLVCLSSGMRVPQETAETMVKLDKLGSTQYEECIKQRLNEKKTAFHAPIQKNKLKPFTELKKTETIKNYYYNHIISRE